MIDRLFALLLLSFVLMTPARAEVRLVIAYSEPADLFQTMDNAVRWWPGFNRDSYRDEWVERFGWSEEDQKWAERYTEYRKRTYSDPTQGLDPATSPFGLFLSSVATARDADPLARYLLNQPDIETALRGLETAMSVEDAVMLRGFFAHFEPKWRQVLDESAVLKGHAGKLDAQFDGEAFNEYLAMVSHFYGAGAQGEFQVFFTRYPPGNGTSADLLAGNVLLLNSPLDWTLEMGEWDTIVAHEFVHYISAQQDDASKRAMSDRFLAICPIPDGAKRLWMIEEPLAVAAGQVAYSELVLGRPLDPMSNWYGRPWIDIASRAIAGSVVRAMRSGIALEESTIVEEAAERCRDLTKLVEELSSDEP